MHSSLGAIAKQILQGNLQLGKNRDKRFELATVGSVPKSSSMDFFRIL